jgi:hypothetical protein
MVARIPWTMLKPAAFEEHAEDVALIYAAKFRADAFGEAQWMHGVIGEDAPSRAIYATLARSLRMAALQLEAASCSTRSGTSPSDTGDI